MSARRQRMYRRVLTELVEARPAARQRPPAPTRSFSGHSLPRRVVAELLGVGLPEAPSPTRNAAGRAARVRGRRSVTGSFHDLDDTSHPQGRRPAAAVAVAGTWRSTTAAVVISMAAVAAVFAFVSLIGASPRGNVGPVTTGASGASANPTATATAAPWQSGSSISASAASRVLFAPDGTKLAVGIADGTIKIATIADGKLYKANSSGDKPVTAFCFNADNLYAVGADGWYGEVNVADPADSQVVSGTFVFADQPAHPVAAFTKNCGTIAATSASNIVLWDTATMTAAATYTDPAAGSSVTSLDFAADDSVLAAGTEAGDVYVYRSWNVSQPTKPIAPVKLTANSGSIDAIACAPAGGEVAAGTAAGKLLLTDAGTSSIASTTPVAAAVTSLTFSPDGSTLAVGEKNGAVQLWNVQTPSRPALVQTLPSRSLGASVNSLTFSPDGRSLAVLSSTGSIDFWHAGTVN